MPNASDLSSPRQSDAAQDGQSKLGVLQELMEARKENAAVRSSNSSLQKEVDRYKRHLHSITSHTNALESDCSAAQESKIVTSKVPAPRMHWSARPCTAQC